MRITGNRLIDLAAASTTKGQAAVGTVSAQLSSGLRVTAPSDPAGAYSGDATVRTVPTDLSATAGVSIAGTALTAARGVDVLPLLDQLAKALSTNDLTTLRAVLPDLDTAVRQVSTARTQA